jgi:hypothetical protein
VLSRAAAARVETAQEAWMLRQPKVVRASYVREVIDAEGNTDLLTEMWMLQQPDDVRDSYVREVLEPALRGAG